MSLGQFIDDQPGEPGGALEGLEVDRVGVVARAVIIVAAPVKNTRIGTRFG